MISGVVERLVDFDIENRLSVDENQLNLIFCPNCGAEFDESIGVISERTDEKVCSISCRIEYDS